MMRKAFWITLSLAIGFLALAGVPTAQAQEATYPPLGEYVLIWRSVDRDPAGCRTLPDADPQASPACGGDPSPAAGDCTACQRPPAADLSAPTVCGSTPNEPPAQLWALLQELQARDQVEVYERLPDQRGLRLRADAEAVARLMNHPATDGLHLLAAITAPAPPTENPKIAVPAAPDVPPAKQSSVASPATEGAAPVILPVGPTGEVDSYTWVNNQGSNPPITYNWTEISSTGAVVAEGDDTYTAVELGFPFTFYGTAYTRAYVSSNGFISFGSGSRDWNNYPIPDPFDPNNAIYALWDDLNPSGGANGNVYVQKTGATTYVIEWREVAVHGSRVTFEIILNGSDNTILLQYQAVSSSSSATIGVENSYGTLATQYAYDSAGAIFANLAIKFTPTRATIYTVAGTVRDYNGTPVPWADIQVLEGPARPYNISTDAEGRYSLTLPQGAYTLRAEKPGYFSTPERSTTVPPDQTGVDLTFPQRFTISGVGRDYDGSVVKDAQVRTVSGPIFVYGSTDATGSYSLTVVAGAYQVEVSKTGYGSSASQTVAVPPSQSSVNFTFAQRYAVTGFVRDYRGLPLVAAKVSAAGIETTTGTSGSYALQLPDGLYCLNATGGNRPSPFPLAVLAPPGGSGLDFTFPEYFTITGVVRDYDGTLLSDISIRTSSGLSARTDANGRYTFLVVAGAYRVTADQEGRVEQPSIDIIVPPNRPDADITFARAYLLGGTVRDAANAALADVNVNVCPTDTGSCDYIWTKSDGRYQFLVPAGAWRVSVNKSGISSPPPQTVAVPPSQEAVDFVFASNQGGFVISGIVRDATGKGVPNLRVRARPGDCWNEATAYTATDGRYAINVSSAGGYLVEAGGERRVVSGPPSATNVDFAVKTYTIGGVVRDSAGKPMVSVEVKTQNLGETVYDYTDTQGRYTLSVPAGAFQVSAYRSGYLTPPSRRVVAPPDQANVDFIIPTGSRILGVVQDSLGRPISYAKVRAEGPEGAATVRTQACGAYELILPAGAYVVSVQASGYANPDAQSVSVPPDMKWLNFILATQVKPVIAGVVRSHDGSPVSGAYVSASGAGDWGSAYTDTGGAYRMSVAPGIYTVSVYKSGYASPTDQTVAVPPDRLEVNFTFLPRYSVHGTVRDGGNHPQADAQITAVSSICGLSATSARTDVSGAYTLTLTAGAYDVSASKDNYAATVIRQVTVPPDAAGFDFTIPLSTRYAVTGVVRDNTGAPLAKAYVSAYTCGRPGNGTYAGADGAYSLLLAPGAYRISASSSQSNYTSPPRDISVTGSTPGIDFDLSPPCCSVYGYVLDDEGAPVSNAYVRVRSGPSSSSDWTSSCGLYRLSLSQPGVYVIEATRGDHPNPVTKTVTLPPSRADADLVLSRGPGPDAKITGIIREENGEPAVGIAVLTCPGTGGACNEAGSTDLDGRYTLSLPPGLYAVYPDTYDTCFLHSSRGSVMRLPPDATVDFTLHRLTNRVSGRLTDNLGAPVYNAYVYAGDRDGYSQYSAYSDSNGNYIVRLSAGAWNLSPASSCSYVDPPDVSVTLPPDRSNLNFVLPRGEHTIEGIITDSSGAAMASVYVVASASGIGTVYAYSDAAGHYMLHVSAGNWQVAPS